MAHYETYVDHAPIVRSGGSNAAGFPKVTVFENEFDASRRHLDAADTADILALPPGTWLLGVVLQVVSGEADQTLTVRDSEDTPNVFITAADVGTTGAYANSGSQDEFYAEGTTLRILVPSGKEYTTLRVKVQAVVAAMG